MALTEQEQTMDSCYIFSRRGNNLLIYLTFEQVVSRIILKKCKNQIIVYVVPSPFNMYFDQKYAETRCCEITQSIIPP
jgi:hypothetical protein